MVFMKSVSVVGRRSDNRTLFESRCLDMGMRERPASKIEVRVHAPR